MSRLREMIEELSVSSGLHALHKKMLAQPLWIHTPARGPYTSACKIHVWNGRMMWWSSISKRLVWKGSLGGNEQQTGGGCSGGRLRNTTNCIRCWNCNDKESRRQPRRGCGIMTTFVVRGLGKQAVAPLDCSIYMKQVGSPSL